MSSNHKNFKKQQFNFFDDQYFYKKLEIDQIFEQLNSYVILEKDLFDLNTLKPMNDITLIEEELAKVNEALDITIKYNRAPIYLETDIEPILDECSKGGIVSGLDLFEIVHLSSTIYADERLLGSLLDAKISVPYYKKDIEQLFFDENLDKILRKSVNDAGEILDDATPELKKIRSRIRNLDERIKAKVNEILQASKDFLADTVIVKRDDRYCLCVKAEYKNTFHGIIRDNSSTNLTCYIEPNLTFQMANEKDELKNEEKEEINKILKNLSNLVGSHYDVLLNDYHIIQELDKRFAKACLGKSYQGTKPHINQDQNFVLLEARHPLLKVDKVIPNSVTFGKEHLGIVISGPNTGGKTVFLKTVGLLSLMVKFGLLIPAKEESDIMIYDHILADIGDDQSITDNLSTFSSHMKKLVSIVNHVTPNSLALFDEIGSGTDPDEGQAIAQGVLKYFIQNKVSFIVTTHYAEIKAFAYKTSEVINASMQFDEKTSNPTYQLVVGQSGSSNALYTAKRLGLKGEILDQAWKCLNGNKSSSEVRNLIRILEKEKVTLLKQKEELQLALENNRNLNDELDKRLKNIENEKKIKIKEATHQAEKIYNDAIIQANEIIDNLMEMKKNAENSSDLKLHEIIDLKHQTNEMLNAKSGLNLDDKTKIDNGNHQFIVGDNVYLLDYEQYGVITRIFKDGNYEVAIGNLKIKASKSEMKYAKAPDTLNDLKSTINVEYTQNKKVSLSLDLRGKRVIEASDLLDKYIDDLLMANIKSATIIHGFGTGAIREYVLSYLKNCRYIKEYRHGEDGEGGYGVTVITLK